MIEFQKYNGPYDIPVYVQTLPSFFQSVSIRLLTFVGAADDETGGEPGIYHWFEHVPFRGTAQFPNGYRDTLFYFDDVGGKVRAHTGYQRTAYYAHVPVDCWVKALELIVDLVSRPLLTDEGIDAERTIIFEELSEWLSSASSYADYHSRQLLWPDHPLGHPIIGSAETLQSMDAAKLREAHTKGYDRRRCVFLVAGPVSVYDFVEELDRRADVLPDHKLSERREPASYGELPSWPASQRCVIDIPFESSMVCVAFPVRPTRNDVRCSLWYDLLTDVCDGPRSPLLRILREQRQLVYSVSSFAGTYFDGGQWGFIASTRPENEEAVVSSLWDVIQSPEIRTIERLKIVRQARRARRVMRVPKPSAMTSIGESRLAGLGQLISDREYEAILEAFSHNEVVAALDSLTPADARTFIFHGRK